MATEPRRILCATLAAAIAFLGCTAGPLARADLQEDIETILAEEGLTGMAWMLVGEAGEVKIGAAGLRDNDSAAAFGPDTRFHVGSLTKTLLATGVLHLATEGRIDLDAPAMRYIPDLASVDARLESLDFTVRHLLDHTSGLDDARLWHMFSEKADPDAPLIAAFSDPRSQLQVRSAPGSRFSYSNMGYTLLGMIIETVAGERYEDYLDKHVLVPLGMHDSTFTFTRQEGDPTLAWGHVDDGSRYAASPVFLRPAGQFTTTAADLVRFAEFLMGDGVIDDQQFVDEALMRSRGKPVGTEAADGGLVAGYALGLGRRDRHGVVGYCHGGNIIGFVAMLCVFPDENKAFAYSVNTDSESANYGRLDGLFVSELRIAEASSPLAVSPAPDISQWHGWYVLSPNRFETFEYLDKVFGPIKISSDGDSLTLASMQQSLRRLRPVGDRIYIANDRATPSHIFLRGEEGAYLISDGFRTYEKVSTTYLAAHWASLLLGLIGLVWLLLAGTMSLIRYRFKMLRQSQAPAFLASVLLFVPIPFFMTQSFMALGDLTFGSVLLAVGTMMLPIGMLLTIMRAKKTWKESRASLLSGLAAVFVLQWCAVLIAVGMLPLRLWV